MRFAERGEDRRDAEVAPQGPYVHLASEATIVVFTVAFARWSDAGERRDLAHLLRASLDVLGAMAAADRAPAASCRRFSAGLRPRIVPHCLAAPRRLAS